MRILLLVLLLGMITGWIRRGSLARLGEAHLRLVPIIFVGVAFQGTAAYMSSTRLAYGLALASYLAVFAFAVANARRAGMAMLALGALLNFTVIAFNGAMPVSRTAMVQAGVGDPAVGDHRLDGLHETLGDDARLSFLADVIPIRAFNQVVSPGDVVLWAGLLLAVQGLMVPRGRRVRGTAEAASRSRPGPPVENSA